MEDVTNKTSIDIEVNSPEFYENVHTEIDSDLARMKKTIETMMNLRLTAAEVEVETAALYHAELWYDLLGIQNVSEQNSEDEGSTGEEETNDTKIDQTTDVK
ncbi:uncharacterized protein LOC142980846 [Anticarsia gemmatalis]|uniref:uncharacterized protein LOC142980846 n=1 Tax=Anticarsia gemmatalis TaxID=129554 RepID=UPI003F7733F9